MTREFFDLIFKKMTNPEFVLFLGRVANALEIHPGYQILPDGVPNPVKIRDVATRLTGGENAAQYGDSRAKAERDAIRTEGEEVLLALASWAVIQYLATKDPNMLDNLGLARKKPAVKKIKVASEKAPQKVRVDRGKTSGSAVLKTEKVPGYASMEVQFCMTDPMQEASWSLGQHFPHCSHMELTGLEPGKLYYFRIRFLGNNGHGPWSAVVSLMVV